MPTTIDPTKFKVIQDIRAKLPAAEQASFDTAMTLLASFGTSAFDAWFDGLTTPPTDASGKTFEESTASLEGLNAGAEALHQATLAKNALLWSTVKQAFLTLLLAQAGA